MYEFEKQQSIEKETHIGLKGALASFEGTALIPLIQSSLEEAGIKPFAYDPKASGHEEYCGFPATDAPKYSDRDPNLSPIVLAIEAALEEGKVVVERPKLNSVRLKPWNMYPSDGSDPWEGNAHRTSKLSSHSLLELKDVETQEVLAYAAGLSSDGGREGYAIISTGDVLKDDASTYSLEDRIDTPS